MKTFIPHNVNKMVCKGTVGLLLGFVLTMSSCVLDSDDVGGNYYTFTGEMMGQYLKAHPDQFSEFVKMLDTTGVIGLLNAYGEYTCFAPTNDALFKFYSKKGRSSIYEFPLDTIKKMVYDHLINEAIITSSEFKNGRLIKTSMSDRFISTKPEIGENGLPVIYINETSPVINKDIEVHNGIVHSVGEVIEPTSLKLKEVIEKNDRYKIFFSALMATGLYKELELVEDKSFVPLAGFVETEMLGDWNGTWSRTPKKRMYGYTALIESDSVYGTYGIKNLEDLKDYAKKIYDVVYPQDAGITDITDKKHSLNRFVAYHLINKQISYSKFVYDLDNTGVLDKTGSHSTKVVDMMDYIEPMCPNTLIEVRTLRATNEVYGVFNMIDMAGVQAVRILKNHKDIDALNGVCHEIDKIIAYTRDFISVLTSKRIRLDLASFFPEITNNNMRANGLSVHWRIPKGYFERLSFTDGTEVNYLSTYDYYCNFQGDEIFSAVPGGVFEVKITTPPIPAGTYEIRFGYLNNGKRGIVQLFFDGQPCGIPVDLKLSGTSPLIGYVKPQTDATDPNGYENDKMMHNRGYMKGPASFMAMSNKWQPKDVGRNNSNCLRRVLGVYTFAEDGTHVLGCKAAEVGEFMLDYLEFTPVEYLESEDIY